MILAPALGLAAGCAGTLEPIGVDRRTADTDGDGVSDHRDVCPNTPEDAAVDRQGCQHDRDRDGVVDADDDCPGTEAGAGVNEHGCAPPRGLLTTVTFPAGRDTLTAGARRSLDGIVAVFRRHPRVAVVLAGHADERGQPGPNRRLAQSRAEAVREYLIEQGVDPDRLVARGYGEDRPVSDDGIAVDRAGNRHVAVRVVTR